MLTRFARFFLVLAFLTPLANATTFDLTGTLDNGSTIGGTFVVDTVDYSSGQAFGGTVTIGAPYSDTISMIVVQGSGYYLLGDSSDDFMLLVFPVWTFFGYTGGELCDMTLGCISDSGYGLTLSMFAPESGSFEFSALTLFATIDTGGVAPPPPVPTPETSTLSLILIGLAVTSIASWCSRSMV